MAIVCNFMNISDDEIKSTIKEMNLTTVDDVGTFTMAGICCGKCIAEIEKLLKG